VGDVGNNTDAVLMRGRAYFDDRTATYTSARLPPALPQAIDLGVGWFSASPRCPGAVPSTPGASRHGAVNGGTPARHRT
jgi:hypothetical protein